MASATYKCLVDELEVRTGPSLSSKSTGHSLSKGQTVTITETKVDTDKRLWGHHSQGWSAIGSQKNTYMQKTSADTPASSKTAAKTQAQTAKEPPLNPEDYAARETQIKSIYGTKNELNKFKLTTLRSIMGLPNQFIWTTDGRPTGSNYGRSFTENVLLDMPICYIIPGGPRFLTGKGVTDSTRKSMLSALQNVIDNSIDSISDVIKTVMDGKVARYYTFQTQYGEYMKIVNALNRTASIYMGIKDKKLYGGQKYENMQWETDKVEADKGSGILNWAKTNGVLSLYFNKSSSGMGETGSNSTTKSMLDGMLNKASGVAKEAAFIMGVGAGRQMDMMNPKNYETQIMNSTSLMVDNFNDASNPNIGMFKGIMNNLNVGMKTVISGANMMLPEIWADSSFARTFTLDIHLHSPYGTPEAVYLNVIVPLNFILALAFPRQLGPNGYYSPFIIQANAKGVFNCDMGIVDYVSIQRFGSGDAISRNGLPLELQVSITIRSLYNSLSVNNMDNYGLFVNNIGLLDFLANISGINLNEPDVDRKMAIMLTSLRNRFTDIPANVLGFTADRVTQAIRDTFKY